LGETGTVVRPKLKILLAVKLGRDVSSYKFSKILPHFHD